MCHPGRCLGSHSCLAPERRSRAGCPAPRGHLRGGGTRPPSCCLTVFPGLVTHLTGGCQQVSARYSGRSKRPYRASPLQPNGRRLWGQSILPLRPVGGRERDLISDAGRRRIGCGLQGPPVWPELAARTRTPASPSLSRDTAATSRADPGQIPSRRRCGSRVFRSQLACLLSSCSTARRIQLDTDRSSAAACSRT